MKLLPLLAAASAMSALSFSVNAATLDVNNGVGVNGLTYSGALPTGVTLDPLDYDASGMTRSGSAPVYSDSGFVWQNKGGYGSDCQSGQGNSAAVTLFTLDNLYDHQSCGNNLGFVRADGGSFSVDTITVAAQDLTQRSPVSSVVSAGVPFLDFVLDEFKLLDELAAVKIAPFTPESDAYVARRQAEQDKLIADYEAWLARSTPAPSDRFYVVGLRGGVEVVRHTYGDTGGQTTLALAGFIDVDEILFGYYGENFLWDHYYMDNEAYQVLGPGQTWCSFYCETVNVFGFDYSTGGVGPVTAVPLPSGLWMMGLALGLLGWRARRTV